MSDAWMNTYDAVFFVSVGTLVIGFLGLVIKYCLKSKCENVRLCWGFIQIKRRVDLETDLEIHEIDAGLTDQQPHPDESFPSSPEEMEKGNPSSLHANPDLKVRKTKTPRSFYRRKDLPPQATSLAPLTDPPARSESTSNSAL